MPDLKPCPFCGSTRLAKDTITIYCRECAAEGPWDADNPEAAWNQRAAGWQAIATAPKNGTHILLYAPRQEYKGQPVPPRLTYGYWFVPPDDEEEYAPYWYSDDGGFTKENPPTHWQPLPEPPKEGGANGK